MRLKKEDWILLGIIAAGVAAVITVTILVVHKIRKKKKLKAAEEALALAELEDALDGAEA